MVKAWLWIAAFPALLVGKARTPIQLPPGTGPRAATRPIQDDFNLKTLSVLAVSVDGTVLHASGISNLPLPSISADMVTLANITGRTVITTLSELPPEPAAKIQ